MLGRRRTVQRYLWLQGVLVTAWWLALFVCPPFRAWFVVADWSTATLWIYAAPDLLVLVPATVVAARGLPAGRRSVQPATWLATGAVLYATLQCASATALTGSGWPGTIAMSLCAGGALWAAASVHRELCR